MVEFIWARKDQHLIAKPGKKYLLYFRACACPPHKGHIRAIAEVVDILGDNCKNIVIDQIGNEQRHGVPKTTNAMIMKTYIKHVFSKNKDVLLADGEFFQEKHFISKWFQDIDGIVFIRGDEDKNRKKVQTHFQNSYSDVLRKLKKHNIECIYYAGKRTKKLSASDFIRAIVRKKSWSKIASRFIPTEVPFDNAKNIISTLAKLPLHDK